MELALPVDPGSLIEARRVLYDASRAWLRDPRPTGEGDERFAEIALVTSDRVLWEPYVCVFGFSSENGIDPLAALDLPFDALFAEAAPAGEIPFLAYSEPFTTLAFQEFLGGAYVLARHFGRSSFAVSAPSLVCMEWCARNAEDVKRCIAEHCMA